MVLSSLSFLGAWIKIRLMLNFFSNMLERILQVKESKYHKIVLLVSKEWTIIENLIVVLRSFQKQTKELSANDVSISIVMLLIATLEKYLIDLDAADEHIGDTITETIDFSKIL